ncbi:alpha/beta fold hydrolase [Streptomyces sp. NPDC087917]|uniref:alpha/beta fold hydrolase n=1 Tax=unclassified Streptomyces TaxID=2593676 RepID=UPI003424BCB8
MILSHDTAGPDDAPALVLLHSSAADRRMWDPLWAPLAEAGHRVVRADFRTCGDSPAAEAPYSDEGDVLALLDHLGIERAAFVGSSYGGRISLDLAARHPERVAMLALLCPSRPGLEYGPDLKEFGAAEDALVEAGDLAGAAELNARTWLGPDAGPRAHAAVREMMLGNLRGMLSAAPGFELPAPEVDLTTITAPTLAVGGAHDLPTFRRAPAEVAALVPGAEYRELPWAGHLPSLERPEEITALLLEFLRPRLG